ERLGYTRTRPLIEVQRDAIWGNGRSMKDYDRDGRYGPGTAGLNLTGKAIMRARYVLTTLMNDEANVEIDIG
ncbi:hypothetical protein GE09DRAFT_981755, partial [Coniochaeta sp. 2T2.1]